MAAITTAIIGLAGVAVSAAGAMMQMSGQEQAAEAAMRAEQLRERQMNLESARSRRETARRALAARAEAVSNAGAQGAAGSSALGGAVGQIAGEAGRTTLAINQNQQIGQGIFQANRDQYAANSFASMGSGISSLGGLMTQNRSLFGRVGAFATGAG